MRLIRRKRRRRSDFGVKEGEEDGVPHGVPHRQLYPVFKLPLAPLLSNIYLHEALDQWFVQGVQPACRGRTFLVRFADDFVMGFERLEDAQKVQRVIAQRFARFGLKINAEKTRLVRFGRPPCGGAPGAERPGSFDFLGFTHYWGKSRRGHNVVKKKTAAGRFRRALRTIKEWGWQNRHRPLKEQQHQLNQKLRGHDSYYGVTGNFRMLHRLRWEVAKWWRRWLARRNRSRGPNWEQFQSILAAFPLLPARLVHSAL
jgi:hypothetical protein